MTSRAGSRTASPATKIAVDEIQAILDRQVQGRKDAEISAEGRRRHVAEIDRAAAAAAKSATDAAAPLAKAIQPVRSSPA